MEEDQQHDTGASILSSVHSSSKNEESISSFLSITPSMLNSSIFSEEQQQTSSPSIHLSHDKKVEASIIPNEKEKLDINSCGDLKDEIDEVQKKEPWYDRSTFESIGNSLLMSENRIEREDCQQQIFENTKESTTDDNENDEGSKTKEKTPLGSILQVGTIVAGVMGILLILAGVGDNRSGSGKKQTKKNKK